MAGRSNTSGKAQSVTEKRLAHVRALKAQYFAEDLTIEEQLQAKDARISDLEDRVAELERRLATFIAAAPERQPRRPQPETLRPKHTAPEIAGHKDTPAESDASAGSDAEDDEPRFNFYRD